MPKPNTNRIYPGVVIRISGCTREMPNYIKNMLMVVIETDGLTMTLIPVTLKDYEKVKFREFTMRVGTYHYKIMGSLKDASNPDFDLEEAVNE